MITVFADFETRSTVDLPKTGVYVYAADPTTDAICMAWAIDEQPTQLWKAGEPFPPKLRDALAAGATCVAHNATFEWCIWHLIMVPRYGWPKLPFDRWSCTMARAYAMSLPGKLEGAAAALGLKAQKDMTGHRLMLSMSRPRKIEADGTIVWWDDPAKLQRLYDYCLQDLETERELHKRVRPLSPTEQKMWVLDQQINARGVGVDQVMCNKALTIVNRATDELNDRMRRATGNAVSSCSNTNQLRKWVKEQGVAIPTVMKKGVATETLAKEAVADLLYEENLPPAVRAALELRREAAKTSNAKIDTLLTGLSKDGRARGLLQYHAASTGRWAGRRFQPQNLPRPKLKKAEIPLAIEVLNSGSYELVSMAFDEPLQVVSDCIRSLLRAGPGRELCAGDFSNIEGRDIAWWAGEHSKLRAFRAYDAGTGPDVYKVAAGSMFGRPASAIEDEGLERQVGKVAELACIAEDELVLTHRGLVAIQDVMLTDMVWDGVALISHEGVVCRGTREVLAYDGLTATADHLVWVEGQDQPVHFGVAAASGAHLVQSGTGGRPIRVDHLDLGRASVRQPMAEMLRVGEMQRLFTSEVGVSGESHAWFEQRLPSVFPGACSAQMADQARHGHEVALRKLEDQGISTLRWPRNQIPISLCRRGSVVDQTESWIRSSERTRPPRQQRTLRTGQSAMGDTIGEFAKPASIESDNGRCCVGRVTQPVRETRDHSIPDCRLSERSRYRLGVQGCSGSPEKLARHPTPPRRARVYDILNAGPRHRFTVSGKLVHNCGYQGGVAAFLKMAAAYSFRIERHYNEIMASAKLEHVEQARENYTKQKSKLPREQFIAAETIKLAWRAANPAIVRLWYNAEEAFVSAIREPGKTYAVGPVYFRMNGSFLWCQLPSTRLLCYPYPKIEESTTPWGAVKDMAVYKGVNSYTRKWEDISTYGGKIVENVVQAIARDFMAEAMTRIDAAGYPVILTVHDEVVAEPRKDFGSFDEFKSLMEIVPTWGKGCPISVGGWRGERYRK